MANVSQTCKTLYRISRDQTLHFDYWPTPSVCEFNDTEWKNLLNIPFSVKSIFLPHRIAGKYKGLEPSIESPPKPSQTLQNSVTSTSIVLTDDLYQLNLDNLSLFKNLHEISLVCSYTDAIFSMFCLADINRPLGHALITKLQLEYSPKKNEDINNIFYWNAYRVFSKLKTLSLRKHQIKVLHICKKVDILKRFPFVLVQMELKVSM